jgi:uncharacterized membrane protein YdbT with pleckstrin-like domain
MSYVDKVLQPGEVVLARTRLHWSMYLGPAAGIILAVAVFGASAAVDREVQPYVEIAGAALCVVALFGLLVAWIKRLSTELAVTNRRVIHKTGFLSRSTQEMNREKVESIDVQQSLAGRIFGYGTVLVRGVGSTWEPFTKIADPLTFRSSITAG